MEDHTAPKDLHPGLAKILFGYRASRILLSAIELDLFSAISGGSTAKAAARKVKGDPRGVEILLHALAATGLVRKTGNRFFNTRIVRDFLTEGGVHDWRLGLGHYSGLWRSWSDLTNVIRQGRPAPRPGKRDRKQTEAFIGLMHQLGELRAPLIARAVDLSGAKTMIDLGGGSGVNSIALVRKKPDLRATIFDQAPVLPIAKRYASAAGVHKNLTFKAGDLKRDGFGRGFDLALLSSICHMFSPEENRSLIRRAGRALAPGGQLVIHDFILNPDRTGPPQAALFAVNMLVNTPGGNSYTAGDYRTWLERAGFRKIRVRNLPGFSGLVSARKILLRAR